MARTKIVLAGEGGQGVQSIAKILVEAGYEANKEILYIPNFGVEQRGGVSVAFCQIGDEKIGYGYNNQGHYVPTSVGDEKIGYGYNNQGVYAPVAIGQPF